MDLACGKGGDLGKFIRAAPGRYVGVDIAKTSLEDAVERLNSDSRRWGAVPVTLGRVLARRLIDPRSATAPGLRR